MNSYRPKFKAGDRIIRDASDQEYTPIEVCAVSFDFDHDEWVYAVDDVTGIGICACEAMDGRFKLVTVPLPEEMP